MPTFNPFRDGYGALPEHTMAGSQFDRRNHKTGIFGAWPASQFAFNIMIYLNKNEAE
jgi:hypothetical protein